MRNRPKYRVQMMRYKKSTFGCFLILIGDYLGFAILFSNGKDSGCMVSKQWSVGGIIPMHALIF